MPEPQNKKNGSSKNGKHETKSVSRSDQMLLKQIGLMVNKVLFERGKPVEWLSFKSGVARSSIREIIAGRSNSRILTLNSIARGLGFTDAIEMLDKVKGKNGGQER
jgi:hypothetical protein